MTSVVSSGGISTAPEIIFVSCPPSSTVSVSKIVDPWSYVSPKRIGSETRLMIWSIAD